MLQEQPLVDGKVLSLNCGRRVKTLGVRNRRASTSKQARLVQSCEMQTEHKREKIMKVSIINRFFIVNLAAILFSGFIQVQAQSKVPVKTDPKTQPVSKSQRETMETVIREFLLKNPIVIREAMQALQVQEEKEKQQLFANNLKEMKSDIHSDPDSPIAGNRKATYRLWCFLIITAVTAKRLCLN
jgi:hypothetical protein